MPGIPVETPSANPAAFTALATALGLPGQNLLSSNSRVRAPRRSDDTAKSYAVGSQWLNTASKLVYVATDVTAGAAVWIQQAAALALPLDLVPVAAGGAAYGMVKLRAAYAGNCMQIVRASDSTTLDVGFVYNVTQARHEADVAAVAAFLVGTTGKVTKWYDQSGNALDAVQTTDTNRPLISMNFIDGALAMTIAGSLGSQNATRWLDLPAGVTFNRNSWATFGIYSTMGANQGQAYVVVGDTTTANSTGFFNYNATYATWAGTPRNAATLPVTSGAVVAGQNSVNAGSITEYENGKGVVAFAGTSGSSIVAAGRIGAFPGFTIWQGYFDSLACIIYPAHLTAGQVASVNTALLRLANITPQCDLNIAIDGTSIEFGIGSSDNLNWPMIFRRFLPPCRLTNMGAPGATLAQRITAYPTQIAPAYLAGRRNILVLGGPTNSIFASMTAAAIWAETQTYVTAARATGWEVIISTAIKALAFTGPQETARQQFNALALASYASIGASGCADPASDPTIAANMTGATAYSTDGTHLTTLGDGYVAPIYAASVQTVLGLPT
jgi:hypothetical protein